MTDPLISPPDEVSLPSSFEQAMAELELLVQAMDSPGVGLDQLLRDYRRGASLVKYCRDRLESIRQEVQQIEANLLDSADNAPRQGE